MPASAPAACEYAAGTGSAMSKARIDAVFMVNPLGCVAFAFEPGVHLSICTGLSIDVHA
jgi:hypothetical protein